MNYDQTSPDLLHISGTGDAKVRRDVALLKQTFSGRIPSSHNRLHFFSQPLLVPASGHALVGNYIKRNIFTAPLPGEESRDSIGSTVSRADPTFYSMHQLHTIS